MELSGYGYTCAAGETMDSVALDIYGDEKYAAELMAANPEYTGQAVFFGMEKLRLPVVEVQGQTAEEPTEAPWKE